MNTHGTPRSVIVVGAGSSGSVIARRLVDEGIDVTVIEGGANDANPAIHDPARMAELWHGPEDWDYWTVPQRSAGGRSLHLPRGRVLGGSHALNAMIWVRCQPEDYDGWGIDGWSWAEVSPVFKRIERTVLRAGADPSVRGITGPLDVTDAVELAPIQSAIIDAAVAAGLPFNEDYNRGEPDGVSQEQVTMRDGQRLTAYGAYLGPVRHAANLRIMTRARVNRLLFAEDDAARVVGIECERDDGLEQCFADEVVLSAGALDSPRILLLSGIGTADELADLGIRSRIDLPGVGRNLHDHLLAPVIFQTTRRIGAPPAGTSPTQAHAFWRSRPELTRPDTQPIFFSVPMYQGDLTGPDDGFSLMAGIIAPRSRGRLTVRSADPTVPADIDIAALEHPDDVASLVASVRQCLDIGMQPPLADVWGATPVHPAGSDADDLESYVRRTAVTYHHQVGTCAMGSGEDAVVGPDLRVRGAKGLRVADASIIPTITSGNTNAPSIMIGERAADLILGGVPQGM